MNWKPPRVYVPGSSPQIAPRFPGATWPGSHATPTPAMVKADRMNAAGVERLFHEPGSGLKGPYR